MKQSEVFKNSLSISELKLLYEFDRLREDEAISEHKRTRARRLMYKGYLKFATPEEALNLETLQILKEILKNSGQKLSGNKSELVSRIIENIPQNNYADKLSKFYIATERGREELEKRNYYIYNYGFSTSDIAEMEKEYSGDQILEQLFLRDVVRHFNDADFGLLRNVYLSMFNFYKQRNRLMDSISALLAVIYFDLTGAGNNGLIDDYKNMDWVFKMSLWSDLDKGRKALNLSDDDLMNQFEKVVSSIVSPPFSYFDVEIMKKIIIDKLSGQASSFEIYQKFSKEPPQNRKMIIKNFLQPSVAIENLINIADKETEKGSPQITENVNRAKKCHHKVIIQRNKGNSLIDFPENYTMVDLETTGFSTNFDHIIEVGCIKYRNREEIDRYQTLINPPTKISPYMEHITKITNEMVSDAPKFEDVAQEIWNYLEGEIIVGHNVNFDINFLYDNFKRSLGRELTNDFVDTMRLARKLLPELRNEDGYNLDSLCCHFGINSTSEQSEEVYDNENDMIADIMVSISFGLPNRHRAICDCLYTNKVLCCLKEFAIKNNVDISEMAKASKQRQNKTFRFSRESLRRCIHNRLRRVWI